MCVCVCVRVKGGILPCWPASVCVCVEDRRLGPRSKTRSQALHKLAVHAHDSMVCVDWPCVCAGAGQEDRRLS